MRVGVSQHSMWSEPQVHFTEESIEAPGVCGVSGLMMTHMVLKGHSPLPAAASATAEPLAA